MIAQYQLTVRFTPSVLSIRAKNEVQGVIDLWSEEVFTSSVRKKVKPCIQIYSPSFSICYGFYKTMLKYSKGKYAQKDSQSMEILIETDIEQVIEKTASFIVAEALLLNTILEYWKFWKHKISCLELSHYAS